MKNDTKQPGDRGPYQTPSLRMIDLSFESSILSGLEGEPIDWDEEIEL